VLQAQRVWTMMKSSERERMRERVRVRARERVKQVSERERDAQGETLCAGLRGDGETEIVQLGTRMNQGPDHQDKLKE
jgi:hypothetical protein